MVYPSSLTKMKEFIIKLNDKFNIPNNITTLTSTEWEIIIKYISDLFLKHDSALSKITESEIQQLFEAKYASDIAARDERITLQVKELTLMKETHEKQLKKLRTTLEDNFKIANTEAIAAVKTTLQGTVESKDLLIQNLREQLNELQEHLAQTTATTVEPLQEQISNLQKELATAHESYDKQMKKQRAALEEQYKANFASTIENNRSNFQEALELKDTTIQTLRNQSSQMQLQLDKCVKMLNELQLNSANNLAEEKAKLQSALEAKHLEDIKELKNQKNMIEENNKLYISSILESKNFTIQELANKSDDLQKQLDKCSTQLGQYLNQLEELRKSNASNLTEEKAKLQTALELRHKEEMKEMKTQSNNVQKQLEDYKKQLHELQIKHTHNVIEEKDRLQVILENKHHAEIKELNELRAKEIKELQNASIEQLQHTLLERLDPITKFYGGSNAEKGNGGEVAIRDILTTCSTYDAGTVTDVSGQTATGDIIFNWGNMKCLIEVKNKKKLTKEDIDKFIRDVNQSADKINCAIFVSLQTNQFPNRSREIMQLDYTNGIPIIFTYMPPPSKEIHFAIACLERIIQTYESTNNDQEELRQHFINYYADVLECKKYFGQELTKHQKEIKSLTKRFDYYCTLYEQLTPSHAKLSRVEIDTENTSTDAMSMGDTVSITNNAEALSADSDSQLEQLAEKYISIATAKSSKNPTAAMLGQAFEISERVVERIGLKNIASRALAIYTARIITEDKIKLILEHYETSGKYPNRKELKDLKILSDKELRCLGSIIRFAIGNGKLLANHVSEYVSSNLSDGATNVEDQTDEPAIEEPTEENFIVEEINDEPLIELPKKRTSSKPKTSTKTKVKPRRKAPVEEPTEE